MNDLEFTIYAHGLVSASVCTNLPLNEATERLNRELPTGIPSGWKASPEPTFASGDPQPGPCELSDGSTHYLFHC